MLTKTWTRLASVRSLRNKVLRRFAPKALPAGYVSRAMFGDKWPLTVDEAEIVNRTTVDMTLTAGDRVYALNGLARHSAEANGWHDLHEIWAVAEGIEGELGLKKSVGPLILHGLAMRKPT